MTDGIIFLMKRTLPLIVPALLFLLYSLFPVEQVVAQPKVFSPTLSAQELIEEVNALRKTQGLPPYQVNPILMQVAQSHADYVAEKGVLTHFSADGKRPFQRAFEAGYPVAGDLSLGGVFAENIHSGINLAVVDVVQAWQAHSTNSSTLLSDEYQDAGAGVATVNGVTYFVFDAGAADNANAGVVLSTPTRTVTAPVGVATGGVAVVPNTPQADGEILHVVRKDEALWSIALAYETTIEELKFLNGLASDNIIEGQSLVIRLASTPTLEPSPVKVEATATFGIPTSTGTLPVTPTMTSTPTPLPKPPASLNSSGLAVGIIVLIALAAAGVGALLGRKRVARPLD